MRQLYKRTKLTFMDQEEMHKISRSCEGLSNTIYTRLPLPITKLDEVAILLVKFFFLGRRKYINKTLMYRGGKKYSIRSHFG